MTKGSCIVAADGIMRDLADVPGGQTEWAHDHPAAAAREFVARHPEFEMRQPEWKVNTSPLTQNVTYWPDGWLWRKRLTPQEIQRGIEQLGPWFYPSNLAEVCAPRRWFLPL